MAAENTVGLAIASAAILAAGYLVVVGLWYVMVYRPSREEREERRRDCGPTDAP